MASKKKQELENVRGGIRFRWWRCGSLSESCRRPVWYSLEYGTWLCNWKSKKIGAGRLTVLTKEEGKPIVRSCQKLAYSGLGFDRMMVGCVVKSYLEKDKRNNPFKNCIPVRGFLQQWPCLSERKSQHFPTCRAKCSTPKVMDKFAENVQVH